MPQATAAADKAAAVHASQSGVAHSEWMQRQQQIAAEYHDKCSELARWRIAQMAEADNEYRQQIFQITEMLLQAAEDNLRDIPQGKAE